MSKKWQVAIYLIHKNSEITRDIYKFLENNKNNYEKKQKYLLEKLLQVNNREKYKPQQLLKQSTDEFELYLYYRKHSKTIPQWKNFLKTIVKDGEDIYKILRNKNESFILFLFHKENKNLYAICGGYGIFTIQNFIDDDFGIKILMRIVKNKDEKILKSVKEFGVTGNIAGIAKYFKTEYNFYENDGFGNIYREISAYIDKNSAKLLGLNNKDTKQCIVRSSFKLNQSVTFNEMIKIVRHLNDLLERKPNFNINEIKLVDSKKNDKQEKLKNQVLNELYKKRNNKNLDENFDFIHFDIEKFLIASKFKILKENKEYQRSDNLLLRIINDLKSKSEADFKKIILNDKFLSYDEEGNLLTQDTIFNHIICEITLEDENYFLVNGKFYYFENNFIKRLNESCKNFIEKNYIEGLDETWNKNIKKESEYNLKYRGKENTIVLDTLVPENIELCDVLKYDKDNVYLFHIKKGFNGAMRDLSSQVFISAKRLLEDIKSDKNYLKQVYRRMTKSEEYKEQNITEKEFLNLFDEKNIIYVLAIKDVSNKKRSINEIEKFKSNIAKFELNELIKKMKSIDVTFKITQIS